MVGRELECLSSPISTSSLTGFGANLKDRYKIASHNALLKIQFRRQVEISRLRVVLVVFDIVIASCTGCQVGSSGFGEGLVTIATSN